MAFSFGIFTVILSKNFYSDKQLARNASRSKRRKLKAVLFYLVIDQKIVHNVLVNHTVTSLIHNTFDRSIFVEYF